MSSEAAPKTLYRFCDKKVIYNKEEMSVIMEEFRLVKETTCGYWITPVDYTFSFGLLEEDKRWVPKKSRKRFAYPTKKEAIISYIARKRSQIRILENQYNRAKDNFKIGIKIAETLEHVL